MENKRTTSNVETTRESFEEPIKTMGRAVIQQQIWRDSMMIPKMAPSLDGVLLHDEVNEFGPYQYAIMKRFFAGSANHTLIKYYDKLPLGRVKGTLNCYSAEDFKDIITDTFGKSYNPILFLDGNKLAFGVGDPILDETAGVLYLRDKDFLDKIKDSQLSISFYKYTGRKGTFGTDIEGGGELPFHDNVPHFMNANTLANTATFKVRGDKENTNYILPPDNGKWYDKGDESDTNVLVTQENIEDVLWRGNVKISGGAWVPVEGITKVYRHGLPSDMEESEEINR